jgi:type I restriction-modification system DNA methylase subunit
MKLDLIEQNLIDKHSKRLLSSLRVICNCYKGAEDDPAQVYHFSSAFLYLTMFVLYAEESKILSKKHLTDFMTRALNKKLSSQPSASYELKEIIKQQCYEVCQAPIFNNIRMNLEDFDFTLNDIINISEYVLLDSNGSRILLGSLKLEFLNYFYEMLLKYSIEKATADLRVIHKSGQETYKEEEVKDHTQLSLNLSFEPEEKVYAGQWIISKACNKNKQCQGAFYTPPKIVNYITEKTLGQLDTLKGKKIIDPACGCGAFLLNVYYYLADKGLKPQDIIKNYLYGIDIDPVSVEISKLILTLASGYYSENIVCKDALEKKDLPFEKNYFDVVIGNPPYLNIERIDKDKKNYYLKHFKSAVRRFDLYIIFIEQAIDIFLKDEGLLGYIIPDKLLTQSYAKGIREIILDTCSISQIVEIKYNGLFKGANVTPIILICKKTVLDDHSVKVIQLKQDSNCTSHIKQGDFRNTFNFIFRLSLDNTKKEILDYIQARSNPVTKACYVSWGLQPGNTKKFIFNESETEKYDMYKNHPNLKDLIRGGCVNTYSVTYLNDKVLYLTEGKDKLHRPAFPELFERDKIVIPAVSGARGLIAALDTNHYYTNHSIINVIMKKDLLEVDKKLLKARGIKLELTKSNQEEVLWQVGTGAYTRTTVVYRTDRDSFLNIRYILGLMNSRLIRFYFNNFLTGELNVFPELVKRLPYLDIDFDEDNYEPKKTEDIENIDIIEDIEKLTPQEVHDQVVRLTYEVQKKMPHERQKYIDLIDKAVYQLYGLDEKYINFIENDLS